MSGSGVSRRSGIRLAAAAAAALALRAPLPAQIPSASRPPRPAWLVEGVPDTVWVLAERASSEADEGRARALLRDAEREARAAVAAHPDDPGRRFGLAVVLGRRANAEGGRTKVRAASELHRELEALLVLDPEHARARHMLGRLHAGVLRMNGAVRWIATRLLGGGALRAASWEEAERNLAFAESRDPAVADHHLQLANLYRDTGRPRLALREVEHVLALPASAPSEREVREEAARLGEALRDGAGGADLPGAVRPVAPQAPPGEGWSGPASPGPVRPPPRDRSALR